MHPPRLAARWLERLLPPDVAESVLGDLEEDFEAWRLRRGRASAVRQGDREVLRLVGDVTYVVKVQSSSELKH